MKRSTKTVRRRPPATKRGPGPEERRKRSLPPRGMKKEQGTTIFVEAEKPAEFAADCKLASPIVRARGLPQELAQAAYSTAYRLMQNPDMSGHDFGKIAGGIASLAKADVETGRFQLGEPAGQINVNNPTVTVQSPRQIMEEYARQVRMQIESAYEPPPYETNGHAKRSNGHSQDAAGLDGTEKSVEG